jgi:SAM-dependent methyltransferase
MNQHFDDTLRYYDDHAEDYARATLDIDMSPFYSPFLAMVPKGGTVLDAGCGSGRDTKTFIEMGYNVTSFDASATMAAFASRLTGTPVKRMRFQELAYDHEFNGVWASASLLHVQRDELPEVVGKIERSLRPGGVLYASFKRGEGERTEDGRHFNDMTEEQVTELFADHPSLSLTTIWVTPDARPERSGDRWVNVLARKAQ